MEIQEQQVPEKTEKKSFAISIPAAIVTAAVVIGVAILFSGKTPIKNGAVIKKESAEQQKNSEQSADAVTVRNTDYVRGDLTKASVVIVEYSDSDCPFCQKFHTTMKEVTEKYGTKVAWVYRYFPLNIHPDAENEAKALACVGSLGGNSAFWNYLDQIIDITIAPEKSAGILSSLAVKEGIAPDMFAKCIASKETEKIVREQSVEAQSYGAQGTPFSVAIGKNGKRSVIAGAYPIEEVTKIIDSLMK